MISEKQEREMNLLFKVALVVIALVYLIMCVLSC